MFELKFSTEDLEDRLRALGSAYNEMPFEMALALNNGATNTRRVIVEDTWPNAVTQRAKNFPGVALHTTFATKDSLRVEIADTLGAANLKLHDVGGTETPKKAARFAVPIPGNVQRTAHGVRADQTPAALIANTPKRNLLVTSRGIYTRQGKGGRFVLRYVFKSSVKQPADVPFTTTFIETMRTEMRTSLPAAMARAMRTRR